MNRDLGRAATAVGALEDATRRRMYLFIRSRGRPVARDEAAESAGISRKLAAFHLDKLVERGLLKTHYARPPGRSGPGAGRSAKYYEPSEAEVAVTLPPRSYEVVAGILVDALESAREQEPARDAARRAAHGAGRELATEVLGAAAQLEGSQATTTAWTVLETQGYEPYRDDRGTIRLRNCPFRLVAQRSPALVCGLNQAFVEGLVSGLRADAVEAILDPRPGECCVRLEPRESTP